MSQGRNSNNRSGPDVVGVEIPITQPSFPAGRQSGKAPEPTRKSSGLCTPESLSGRSAVPPKVTTSVSSPRSVGVRACDSSTSSNPLEKTESVKSGGKDKPSVKWINPEFAGLIPGAQQGGHHKSSRKSSAHDTGKHSRDSNTNKKSEQREYNTGKKSNPRDKFIRSEPIALTQNQSDDLAKTLRSEKHESNVQQPQADLPSPVDRPDKEVKKGRQTHRVLGTSTGGVVMDISKDYDNVKKRIRALVGFPKYQHQGRRLLSSPDNDYSLLFSLCQAMVLDPLPLVELFKKEHGEEHYDDELVASWFSRSFDVQIFLWNENEPTFWTKRPQAACLMFYIDSSGRAFWYMDISVSTMFAMVTSERARDVRVATGHVRPLPKTLHTQLKLAHVEVNSELDEIFEEGVEEHQLRALDDLLNNNEASQYLPAELKCKKQRRTDLMVLAEEKSKREAAAAKAKCDSDRNAKGYDSASLPEFYVPRFKQQYIDLSDEYTRWKKLLIDNDRWMMCVTAALLILFYCSMIPVAFMYKFWSWNNLVVTAHQMIPPYWILLICLLPGPGGEIMLILYTIVNFLWYELLLVTLLSITSLLFIVCMMYEVSFRLADTVNVKMRKTTVAGTTWKVVERIAWNQEDLRVKRHQIGDDPEDPEYAIVEQRVDEPLVVTPEFFGSLFYKVAWCCSLLFNFQLIISPITNLRSGLSVPGYNLLTQMKPTKVIRWRVSLRMFADCVSLLNTEAAMTQKERASAVTRSLSRFAHIAVDRNLAFEADQDVVANTRKMILQWAAAQEKRHLSGRDRDFL